MFCAKCGHKNPDNSLFCSACGQRVVATKTPMTPQSAPMAPVQRQAAPSGSSAPVQQRPMQATSGAVPPRRTAPIPPAPRKKKKNGNGALIVTVIVLLFVIIVLVGVLIYFMLDEKSDSSEEKPATSITDISTEEDTSESESNTTEEPSESEEQASSSANTTEESQENTATLTTEEPTEAEPTETQIVTTQPATTQPSNAYGPLDENGYLLADSDKRYLTQADVEGLSKDQLQYAINEIFARRGRIFQSEQLQAHFESLPWYYGTTLYSDFSNDVFNEYERVNIEFLFALKNS